MDDHIYRVIELVGSSQTSIEDAVNAAIDRANATI
jgi:flavin-binding protein dodecin